MKIAAMFAGFALEIGAAVLFVEAAAGLRIFAAISGAVICAAAFALPKNF